MDERVGMFTTADDGSPDDRRGGSRRRCAVTRRVLDKSALIRFVRAPDGAVVPDIDQTLPGRGVWVSAERALVAVACRKGILARTGCVPDDLAARCEAALAARALALLGLARRAGRLAIGARAVRARDRRAGGRPRQARAAARGGGARVCGRDGVRPRRAGLGPRTRCGPHSDARRRAGGEVQDGSGAVGRVSRPGGRDRVRERRAT